MSISRRGFLGGVSAGAAGALISKPAAAAGHKRFTGYPGRFGLLHDTTLCVGCRSCEAACNEVNNLPQPQKAFEDKSVFSEIRRTTDKALTVVNRYESETGKTPTAFRKLQCMHCNEPCCASVCFVKAFTKTPEGPVLYDPSVCVGCRYCVMACPYYALGYEYDEPLTPRVMRCTMCYPRIKEGLNPACADACPMGAITFGPRKDLIKTARERIRKNPDQYIDHVFGEHEFGGTSWLVLAGVPFKDLALPEGATHTPIPEIGSSFLSVVPLVLSIYPGLLLGIYAFSKRKEKLSRKELETAVADSLAKADDETKMKLAEAAKKAGKDKEKAIAQAVKKALAEVAAPKKEDSK
ncbi:MAG: 4Fe-4S dicluster domain-containing protein [Pseudomonadota bacterium]